MDRPNQKVKKKYIKKTIRTVLYISDSSDDDD